MKIGIASCYYNRNYGSMLQAYATQRIVEELGHEAITIQCLAPINYMTQPKREYYFHKLYNLDIVKSKLRQIKGWAVAVKDGDYKKNVQLRNRRFDEFFRKYIKLSGLNKDRKELTEFAAKMDAVIVGSDMLWHPINIEHDYFTLTFVPDEVKRISYATSFGTTRIPSYQRRKAKEFLERFNAISVRENSGLEVLKELGVNRRAKVVLDPTLLFPAEKWEDIQNSDRIIDGKYIFCYFLGVNKKHREYARTLRKQTGYKIVTLPHLDEYVPEDVDFGDISLFDIGPSDFLNLIRNAEYVLTDSFHGTCFSILCHKKFVTFNRFQTKNTLSTNTRIDSILQITGLSQRHITEHEKTDEIWQILEKQVDFSLVDIKLENARTESIDFLVQSFE